MNKKDCMQDYYVGIFVYSLFMFYDMGMSRQNC